MLPADLKLAVVEPGTAKESETEAPAESGTRGESSYDEEFENRSNDAISLRAAKTTPAMPTIYTRAQWGADESIRNPKNLRYGTVSAGFVHHTVNANDYTEAQVPGIIAASTPTTSSRVAGATSATTSSSTGSVASGRAGTAASTRTSSAHTPWATTTTPSRCRRSATSTLSSRPRP